MCKVLVSDYDNTFYTNDDDYKLNIKKVNEFRLNNNVFAFATGRSYNDFKNILDESNINYDYLILNHGAEIRDCNDNILNEEILDKNIINMIVSDLKLDKSLSYFCCSIDSNRLSVNSDNLVKISIKYRDTDTLNNVYSTINEKYYDLVNIFIVSKYRIEIVTKKASKSKAISFLIKKFCFDKNKVYTIGDGESDISMIKEYNGYCMDNSIELLNGLKKYKCLYEMIDDILESRI